MQHDAMTEPRPGCDRVDQEGVVREELVDPQVEAEEALKRGQPPDHRRRHGGPGGLPDH
jgi:hypothetical protein